ncbi:hypothetical protein LTS10_009786 [Elasticomyces elasticus]|nr:hypothetical protein LTS10_009786 [Elasticomyces elasticus]
MAQGKMYNWQGLEPHLAGQYLQDKNSETTSANSPSEGKQTTMDQSQHMHNGFASHHMSSGSLNNQTQDSNHQQQQDHLQQPASPPSSANSGGKRQRAKQACEPCRLRKRRCDGNSPCNMCTQFEYKCYFEKHPRKRSKLVERGEALHDHSASGGASVSPNGVVAAAGHQDRSKAVGFGELPAREDRSGLEDATKLRSLEANSGLAFARYLGLKLDPSSGPKLFTFGWNLGSSTYAFPKVQPITELLGREQMFALAGLYFGNVHPLYGFLDQEWVMEQLGSRWSVVPGEVCKVPDHLLAGIAALGILWVQGDQSGLKEVVLPKVVELAKQSLEGTSIMQPPCLMDVQSWNLRSLYLRLTDHPHATWMATCTAMHLVESTGIHQEQSSSTLHYASAMVEDERVDAVEIRRRTFWIARMLNTWFSFEYGRTRVALRGITCRLPTAREGDYTTDYINLYSVSCCLDPDRTNQAEQWEEFIRHLESLEARHDGIVLSKANLALCGYRRIRLANPTLSNELLGRIISIGLKGLDAARRTAEKGAPWWHVANVPFQVICVFLAMDVRESLMHIATAMRTLEDVVERFKTAAMKEALKTARFLVRLSKRRKDEDSDVLGRSLKKVCACLDCDPQPENLQPRSAITHVEVGNGPYESPPVIESGVHPSHKTPSASSEDWNLDMLNNADFDWNYFLDSMPLVHMETNM